MSTRYTTCQYVRHSFLTSSRTGVAQICVTVRDLETGEDHAVFMDLEGKYSDHTGDSLAALGATELSDPENIPGIGSLKATLRLKKWQRDGKSGWNPTIFPLKERKPLSAEEKSSFADAFAGLKFEPIPVAEFNKAGELPSPGSADTDEDELPF